MGTMLFLVLEGPLVQDVSPKTARFFVALGMVACMVEVLSVAVHFWYRYEAVCKSRNWSRRRYFATFMALFLYICMHHLTVVEFQVSWA